MLCFCSLLCSFSPGLTKNGFKPVGSLPRPSTRFTVGLLFSDSPDASFSPVSLLVEPWEQGRLISSFPHKVDKTSRKRRSGKGDPTVKRVMEEEGGRRVPHHTPRTGREVQQSFLTRTITRSWVDQAHAEQHDRSRCTGGVHMAGSPGSERENPMGRRSLCPSGS